MASSSTASGRSKPPADFSSPLVGTAGDLHWEVETVPSLEQLFGRVREDQFRSEPRPLGPSVILDPSPPASPSRSPSPISSFTAPQPTRTHYQPSSAISSSSSDIVEETPLSLQINAQREENLTLISATERALLQVQDLTTSLSNPLVPSAEILLKLQVLSELPQIAEQVGLALNSVNPELAIRTNPFVLLRIRNYDGLNLLEQLTSHLTQKLEQYQGIDQLLDLEHYAVTRLGSRNNPPSKQVIATAFEKFNALPPASRNAFCEKVWQLCGSPDKINFGENYVRQNGNIYLFHHFKGKKIAQEVVLQLQEKALTPMTFNTMYVYPEEVKLTDSAAIREDMQKFYQIQDFNNFLHDPFKVIDPHFLSTKFRQLDPEIRESLCRLAWIGSYRPEELDFGGKFIQRDFTILLEMKDQAGKPILDQMLEHFKVKIKAERELEQLDAFVQAAQRIPALSKTDLIREFEKIEGPLKSSLRKKLWKDRGGRANPKFGKPGWARDEVNRNPRSILPVILERLPLLQEKAQYTLSRGIDIFDAEMAVPEGYVVNTIADILNDPEIMARAPTQIQVAMATAEFARVINVGGLAGAVQGIAKGLGERNVHVIMPKFDTLPKELQAKMTPVARLQVQFAEKVYRIFEAVYNDTHFYFIEDNANFTVGYKEGKPLNIYQYAHGKMASDFALKRRWAIFQSIAAELIYKLSKDEENPVNVVQVHDSQTSLIPSILKARHPEEWQRGETPATVFTFHNNLCQQPYDYYHAIKQLEEIGLKRTMQNSFTQGLMDADVVSTVSIQYSIEAQTPQFGQNAHRQVKAIASQGKLYGIVNGNTNDWDPATNPTLKNWKTLDGRTLDLSYGPDTPDLRDKLINARKELAVHLAHHGLGLIDPTKPIVFFLGRYDSHQKGIDKLPIIMEEAIANGAQFICIGTIPDERAAKILRQMQDRARELGNEGVIVLQDKPDSDGRLYYQQVLGLGPLMRASVDVVSLPSSYEPCGLVQGEAFRFGKKALTTDTGGFHDTVITEGPKKNGYLFERLKWQSEEQNEAIRVALRPAIEDAKTMLQALYHGDDDEAERHLSPIRTLMRDAIQSTWTETPDGSIAIPAIYQYDLLFAKALKERSKRVMSLPIKAHLLTRQH